MRVLHILDHSLPKISGYAIRSHAILKHLKSYGVQVFALTSDRQGLLDNTDNNIDQVHYLRSKISPLFQKIPLINQLYTIINLIFSLEKIINHVKPNIIHAHSPCLIGIAGWYVSKRYHLPFVYEIRAFWEDAFDANTGRHAWLRRQAVTKIETFLCHHSEKVIVICQGIANELIKRGIERKKIFIVPNGAEHKIAQSHQMPNLYPSKKVIGFIGSLYAYEGILILCRSFLRCCYDYPNLHLLLIGSGPMHNQIQAFIDSFHLKDKITIIPSICPSKIGDYYKQCDLFVYPRLSCPLTERVTPLKPLEAIAYRKPILLSNVGGLKEIMPDAPSSAFFEAGNVDALSDLIHQWLLYPTMHDVWVEKAYQNLMQKKQWSKIVQQYLPEYNQLICST